MVTQQQGFCIRFIRFYCLLSGLRIKRLHLTWNHNLIIYYIIKFTDPTLCLYVVVVVAHRGWQDLRAQTIIGFVTELKFHFTCLLNFDGVTYFYSYHSKYSLTVISINLSSLCSHVPLKQRKKSCSSSLEKQ